MPLAPGHLPAEMVEVVVEALESAHPHVHLHLLVDLERRLSHEQLVEALHGLVRAFPVLGCRYQPHWWRDRWVPWEGDLASMCHVAHTVDVDAATRSWAARPMRYREEPTVRLAFFDRGDGGGRLVLSLHHMTADGGGTKAAGAVLAALLCGVEPDPPASDDRALRNIIKSLRLEDLPVLLQQMALESISPLSFLRVRELDHGAPEGDGRPDPLWIPLCLDRERTARFVAACKGRGATINDGLVAVVARMAAHRSERGPVMVAYTVDLRRYLRWTKAQVTNLAGVTMVLVERGATASATATLDAVVRAIGVQKRRLTGLAYALLPAFTVSWLPHSLMRRVGAAIIGQILKRFHRSIALTNIGSLDEVLAPFGDDVSGACIVGPFVHNNRVPIITITGFRGTLTLQVVSTHTHREEQLANFARELEALLEETMTVRRTTTEAPGGTTA
jgi:NRPS condensation-like uncharacterized protein